MSETLFSNKQQSTCAQNLGILNEIPNDLLIEIFQFVKPPRNEEWFFFMIQLPMVCKRWNLLLKESEQGNFLYKFLYERLFLWRNDGKVVDYLNNQSVHDFWFSQLKNNVNFYRNCKIDTRVDKGGYTIVQDRSLLRNDIILFKKSIGSSIASINRPLRPNTGCYYFECVFMDKIKSSDNIFFGVELLESSSRTNSSYIGFDNNSIGYYLGNGSIYYDGKVVSSKGRAIKTLETIGLLIDTNNLTLEYISNNHSTTTTSTTNTSDSVGTVLIKIDLNEKASNIANQMRNESNVAAALLPCVSILYDNQRMKMKCFEICSFEKFNWLQDLRKL